MGGSTGRPEAGTPFRVLVVGDFSGRGLRGEEPGPGPRRPVRVDRDGLDALVARLAPEVHVAVGGARVPVAFRSMEDFHPDRIWATHGLFARLRRLRERLADARTFAAAAAEFAGMGGAVPAPDSPPPSARRGSPALPAPPPDGGASLLGDVLGESERRGVGRTGLPETDAQWDALVDSIVGPALAPLVLPGADPRQAAVLERFDALAGDRLRELMHAPPFRAAEATWRSLAFLVNRLETDASLQIHVLDLARDHLFADLPRGAPLERSSLWKTVVDGSVGTPGAEPWAALVVEASFGPVPAEVLALLRLARVAAAAGAPVLAAADPSALGVRSLAETPDPDDWGAAPPGDDGLAAWEALRAVPEAQWVALTVPRLLLRAPWGRESARVEEFDFEEMAGGADHDRFLWGNGAFGLALLLGDAYARDGWDMDGMRVEIGRLPVFPFDDDGEPAVKPCAEVVLTERAGQAILDAGLVPWMSVRGTDSVRLLGLRALGEPRGPLRGRWSS